MEVENEALAFGQAEDLRRECVRKVEASLRGMESGDEQGDIPTSLDTCTDGSELARALLRKYLTISSNTGDDIARAVAQ